MQTVSRPPWTIRRRIIVGTLIFCAVVVIWLAFAGRDTSVNQAIASGLILLAGGVIGSYVFGAAWDDLNVMRTLGAEAYPPPAIDPLPGPSPPQEPLP